jgi:pimeloyl-ACP methyl ester carboxylesterase
LTRHSKKLTGRLWTIIALLFAGLLLLVTGGAWFLPYWMPTAIVYAPNFGKRAGCFDEATPVQLAAWGINQQIQVPVGPPSARLSVWVMEPIRQLARGTVLVLHGIRDSKASMRGIGRLLADGGYRAVLVDLRGHGSSSGDWLTYGTLDSQDLTQVLDAIDDQNLLTEPVGVFGCSYGAATAIQLAGRDPRIRSVVAVAPFSTLHGAIHSYARLLGIGLILPGRMIDQAVEDAGRIAHFQPSEANPLQAIQQTAARVLLIHGTADWKIPWSSSQQLHDVAPSHSRLILVKNAGHDSVMAEIQSSANAEILGWFHSPSED